MAGSSEPAFSFEYKKGAIAPWMITHLFCNSPKDFMQGRLDREQPGEQRYKDHADHGYTSAGHELLHAL